MMHCDGTRVFFFLAHFGCTMVDEKATWGAFPFWDHWIDVVLSALLRMTNGFSAIEDAAYQKSTCVLFPVYV